MLYALQRKILSPAPPPRALQARAGTLVEGRSPQGAASFTLWSPAPRRDERTWTAAYFHGNGMQLADCAELAPALPRRELRPLRGGVPGYGPLAGDAPGEAAIVDAADGAMAPCASVSGSPPSRTLLLGQSLGTGVAVQLAARGAGARVVLLTPYRSITAMAGELFPWLPVGLLVRDRFDSEALAPSIPCRPGGARDGRRGDPLRARRGAGEALPARRVRSRGGRAPQRPVERPPGGDLSALR